MTISLVTALSKSTGSEFVRSPSSFLLNWINGSFVAEISIRLLQQLFILVVYKHIFWIAVSEKYLFHFEHRSTESDWCCRFVSVWNAERRSRTSHDGVKLGHLLQKCLMVHQTGSSCRLSQVVFTPPSPLEHEVPL